MDRIKAAIDRAEKFVDDHKVAITVFAMTALAVKWNKMALRDHESFMAEKGILEEFYTLAEDEDEV